MSNVNSPSAPHVHVNPPDWIEEQGLQYVWLLRRIAANPISDSVIKRKLFLCEQDKTLERNKDQQRIYLNRISKAKYLIYFSIIYA